MGRVGLVLAEDAAGREDADGRLLLLHHADLHRAGLRAQQDGIVVVEIERVGAVAGRMPLLDVQAGEVIAGLLDLRAVDNRIAHADEDLLDLLQHLVHRVLMPHREFLAGDGHVDGLRRKALFQRGGLQLGLAALELRLDLGAHAVGQLTHDRALLGGQLAHLLQDGGQLALFAQNPDAQRVERGRVGGGVDGLQRLRLGLFQLLFHSMISLLQNVM